jgi:putative flippase GtrA
LQKTVRFLTASVVSTGVDYAVFFTVHLAVESIVVCQFLAQASGFASNLLLQRSWVFEPNRSGRATLLRLIVSIGLGFSLGAFIVHELAQIPFFEANKLLLKVATTLLLGVYNFLTRRWSFEK